MEIKTEYTRIDVNNSKFALFHVVSKISNKDTTQIDCRRLIEKKTKKAFDSKFTNELDLVAKETHWYVQFLSKTFEAIVIVI